MILGMMVGSAVVLLCCCAVVNGERCGMIDWMKWIDFLD
jgi:hypothetical protein